MDILLDLRHHCVETALKRCRNAAISSYFKSGTGQPELEARIELLGQALQRFDFAALRKRWPVLSGGTNDPVRLVQRPGGKCEIQAGRIRILPPAVPHT